MSAALFRLPQDDDVATARSHVDGVMQRLPLLTLYLSERCNSRCITCDYWRHGRADMSLDAVERLLPAMARLDTRAVLVSGGEPLLNPQWADIARLLRAHGLKLWLLTSGLSLAKHAQRVAEMFDTVTVSLDGTNGTTYAAIRGLDAFDNVCAGIDAAVGAGSVVTLRVTLQRDNYRELPEFIALARARGVHQISFLPVDVANPHAFARREAAPPELALRREDLAELGRLLGHLERVHAEEFRRAFIAESPQKMRRILQYFTAVCRLGPFPPVRCNAPEFSAVMTATGALQPCFFIAGVPAEAEPPELDAALNGARLRALRGQIRAGERPECHTCVCSMWRDPASLGTPLTMLPQLAPRSRA